ncbi:LytR/AlgR family response regulator transcription factor [Chryseobacterium scophthalmum]|uniref:Two component transcriptional regulator, LytTR family n=1 Tax=Chryseobacterium scophthalmum TaxID=59733 RepID=A0A1N6FEM1_9FLAO|nr:response regulator transcription factor [Chryseobacterium scophthalmum]SIN93738.1 two component transcriptional regulator, LytTR family [Chryseobacterium scophthalmum]
MSKVNILIFEDLQEDAIQLSEVLLTNHYNVIGIAATFEQALNYMHNEPVDILIIDIFIDNHPEGINLAQMINANPKTTKPFVFLTNSSDRRVFEKAKLTKPFSYLLKPFNELEILYAIEVAIEKFYEQTDTITISSNPVVANDYIFIKKGKSLKKVSIKDIIYIEVEERYCNVITESEKYLIQISLAKFLPFLESNQFIRTHRNYMVNPTKIIEVTLSENTILLQGNHIITLSNKYKDFLSNYKIF